jgi:hypothetical protein
LEIGVMADSFGILDSKEISSAGLKTEGMD